MKKKSLFFAIILSLSFLPGPLNNIVLADEGDFSETGDSGDQDPDNPPKTDTGDNGNSNTTGGDSGNTDQNANTGSVNGFDGDTTRPTSSTTINTTRPATTILDDANQVTNTSIRDRLGFGLVTEGSDDSVENLEEDELFAEVETIQNIAQEDTNGANSITTMQYSAHRNRNLVLLVVSALTSLGVVLLAVFASVFIKRINQLNSLTAK